MSSERGAELLVACAASVGRAKSAAGPQCTAATATCWGISSAPRRRHTSWRTYQHWPGETIPQLHGWLDSATLHLVYSYFAGGRNIDPLEFRGSYSFFSYCVVLCHSLFYFLYCIFLCLLPKWQINLFIVPHRIIWNWYTDRWWVGCYIWYSEEETGWGRSPPLLAVPNVTAHPSMASVPITIFLYPVLLFKVLRLSLKPG